MRTRACMATLLIAVTSRWACGADPVTLHPESDATISAQHADRNLGGTAELVLRSKGGYRPGSKCYLKFRVPQDVRGRIRHARLDLTVVHCAPWNYGVDLFGLKKGAAPWDETSITWKNAPASRADSNYWRRDVVLPLAQGGVRGAKRGGKTGDTITLTDSIPRWYETGVAGVELARFLNEHADADGFVTLLLTTRGTAKYFNSLASREHAKHPPPALVLHTAEAKPRVPTPEEQELRRFRTMASERWRKWRLDRKRFPFVGWDFMSPGGGWGEDPYRQYAKAGFSMVRVNEKTYPLAVAAGLEVMFGWWQQLHKSPEGVARFMGYPSPDDRSVVGYFLDDEPDKAKSIECWERAKEIYLNDRRDAIPFVNLGHEGCPAVLLSTCYTLLTSDTTRPIFYPHLEEMRRASKALNVGFMGWALVSEHTSGSTHFRNASESDLYWQAYSIVAYGGKGVWCYRYDGHLPWFTADGEPTEFFTISNTVSSELHRLWPVVKHLESVAVYHTLDEKGRVAGASWSPCHRFESFGWNVDIYREGDVPAVANFQGKEWLLGVLRNAGDPGDQDLYVFFQNKRHGMAKRSQELTATAGFALKGPYRYAYGYDPQTGALEQKHPDDTGRFELTLGGGRGLLMRFARKPLLEQSPAVMDKVTK